MSRSIFRQRNGESRLVITDRLHARILCMLLGSPHIVLNKLMGKNWNV